MQFPLKPNQVLNLLLTQWQCAHLGPSPLPTPSLPHHSQPKSLLGASLPIIQHPQQKQQSSPPSAGLSRAISSSSSSSTPPLLNRDFPDPSIIQDTNGTWYAFATASAGRNIQAASAPSPSGPWTYINQEILPSPGNWTLSGPGIAGGNTWAPDVRLLSPTTYVMYYSGQMAGNASAFHCVGAATSTGSILGPYTPLDEPLACPLDKGGAIDPAGFVDEGTGRRYVVYKVDGNSLGNGGECNNGVKPYRSTPIVLQEVDGGDGVTKVGEGVEILDREEGEDGPLVEAPSLVRVVNGGDGGEGGGGGNVTYVLFYSSHCWATDLYRVNYATAENVTGPYVRSKDGKPLIASGDVRFNLTAPGGATSVDGGGMMVFHANCEEGRCLFETGWEVLGEGEVVVRE